MLQTAFAVYWIALEKIAANKNFTIVQISLMSFFFLFHFFHFIDLDFVHFISTWWEEVRRMIFIFPIHKSNVPSHSLVFIPSAWFWATIETFPQKDTKETKTTIFNLLVFSWRKSDRKDVTKVYRKQHVARYRNFIMF